MLPSASKPQDLRLALNPARRRALTVLIEGILTQMRNKVVQSFEKAPTSEPAPLFVDRSQPGPSNAWNPEEAERQRRLEARLESDISTPALRDLKRAALKYFDCWQDEVNTALGKIVNVPENARSERERRDWQAARAPPPPPPYTPTASDPNPRDALTEAEARDIEEAKDASVLQTVYPPVPTRLTTISKEDRVCVLSCMVLLLLSLGYYSAHSRVLLCYLTSSLGLPISILTYEETGIARTLLLASKELSADAETQKRREDNASARRWKVGLASVAGAAVIGITGGIAGPIVAGAIGGIMSGVGLGGVASFLGIFAMNGALVGTLFGAFGGKMTGEMVDSYAKEVSDFKFLPLNHEWGAATREDQELEARRLRVTITINGWLENKDDVVKPWRVLGSDSEVFALRYEMEALLELGRSLKSMVSSYAWSFVKLEILKRTVLATLWSALWPVYLLKMATSIDNPFAVARNRSEKAGQVLADALINKSQGERPVTLVGYSLGARVIYSCLKSLAERKAFGLVESAVFIGAPVPSNSSNWRVMRSVVSGKVINVYSENDYILAFLYRATSIQFGVAGLQQISDVEGVDNLNLSKEVSGHLRYPDLIGKILKKAGFAGIKVEDADIEEEQLGEIGLIDLDVDADATVMSGHGLESLIDLDNGLVDKEGGSVIQPNQSVTGQPPTYQEAHMVPARRQQLVLERQTPECREVAAVTNTLSQARVRDEDSESDDSEIQMVDNDDDGELMHLPSEPIPDHDKRIHQAQATSSSGQGGEGVVENQKYLGSFPKDKGKKVRASDLGLY